MPGHYLPLRITALRLGRSHLTIDIRGDGWDLTGLDGTAGQTSTMGACPGGCGSARRSAGPRGLMCGHGLFPGRRYDARFVINAGTRCEQGCLAGLVVVAAEQQVRPVRAPGRRRHHCGDRRPGREAARALGEGQRPRPVGRIADWAAKRVRLLLHEAMVTPGPPDGGWGPSACAGGERPGPRGCWDPGPGVMDVGLGVPCHRRVRTGSLVPTGTARGSGGWGWHKAILW